MSARIEVSTVGQSAKQLSGTGQLVARVVWVILTLSYLTMFAFSLPAYYAQLHDICAYDGIVTCQTGQLTHDNVMALARAGIPFETYIVYMLSITIAASLIFLVVGFIIFWRKSQEWFAIFASLLLIVFGCCGSTRQLAATLAAQYPDLLVAQIASRAMLQYPGVLLFFCLFPDGRLVPRWSWLFVIPGSIGAFLFTLPPDSPFSIEHWPGILFEAFITLFYGSGLCFQVYRYRAVSRPDQRQQTKWFVFACALTVSFSVLDGLISGFVPAANRPDSLYFLFSITSSTLTFLLPIPLGIGIAILRYRLWDIDVLINRALVYGLLTTILLATYLALVFGGQFLLTRLLGSPNDAVLVVSTLIIASLFLPLRQRVQQMIDRRFYRRKYDATRILSAFSATLHNEVNLEQLSQQIVGVVEETMQPAHVSLWLRAPQKKEVYAQDA